MKIFKFKKNHKETFDPNKHRSFFRLIGRDPRVDWIVMIILSLVVAAVLTTIGLFKYFYFETDLSKKNQHTKKDLSQALNADSLDKVLHEFAARATLRDSLIHEYVGPKDPSI